MRLLFILFLSLHIPGVAGAVASMPAISADLSATTFTASGHEPGVKHGFIKRMAEKMLKKRLKKALNLSGTGDGTGGAITGFTLGLLGAVSWAISPYLGFFVSLPLGLIGLLLSTIGLRRARSWNNTGLVPGLAITGIVLNSILLGVMLLALVLSN